MGVFLFFCKKSGCMFVYITEACHKCTFQEDFSMKRLLLCAALLMLLYLFSASAETLGFGYVNATDVALRRGVGGAILTRLPKDTCVWISDSKTDAQGALWYKINAGLHVNHANYDYSGWMKADFIDAGDAIWHDVTALAADNSGLIVLRSDGSTETAGRPIIAPDASGLISPRGWAAHYGKVIRVGLPPWGNEYFIVTENNEFISSVNRLRVAEGMAKADSCETAEIPEGQKLPAWSGDADLMDFHIIGIWNDAKKANLTVSVGLRSDGTMIAEPASLNASLADWKDIAVIRLSDSFVVGLKKDGTALLSAFSGSNPPDVSRWQDVIAIACGSDYCVGLKKDGTLLFAGDHIFMGEGHTRN